MDLDHKMLKGRGHRCRSPLLRAAPQYKQDRWVDPKDRAAAKIKRSPKTCGQGGFLPGRNFRICSLSDRRQTVFGTRRAVVNEPWMALKILVKSKLGLLEEVHCPLFSCAVASE